MFEQQLAGFGGQRATPVAHEQVLPQLDLEQAHLAAQCRLRHVQGDPGAGKAAELGHADEIFQLLEVQGKERAD